MLGPLLFKFEQEDLVGIIVTPDWLHPLRAYRDKIASAHLPFPTAVTRGIRLVAHLFL